MTEIHLSLSLGLIPPPSPHLPQFIDERLSHPDFSLTHLVRQPSSETPAQRRFWLKTLVGRRRLFSSDGPRSGSVTAPLRGAVPVGRGVGTSPASQSAPASPASRRLRVAGPSAPELLQLGQRRISAWQDR